MSANGSNWLLGVDTTIDGSIPEEYMGTPTWGNNSDGSSTTSTSTNVWDVIQNALSSGFGLYKSGVDAKIGAAQTELSWPKMIVDAGILITVSVLIYKLLAGGKRKAA